MGAGDGAGVLYKSSVHSQLLALLQPPGDAVSGAGGRKHTGAVCKFAFAPHLVTAKFYCVI